MSASAPTTIPRACGVPMRSAISVARASAGAHLGAAFRPAAGFHERALFQAGQDQLQKFLGDFLPPGDVRDLDRLTWFPRGEVEQGQQRVFAFH